MSRCVGCAWECAAELTAPLGTDARITSTDTTLALSYYGMVRQTTGESWNNTKLVRAGVRPGSACWGA